MTRRLLASWLSLALLVLVALELPLALSYAHNQRSDALVRLERDATAVGALSGDVLRRGGDLGTVARVVRRYGDEADGRIVVVDRTGKLLVGAAGVSSADAVRALSGQVVRSTGGGHLSVAVPVTSSGVVIGAVGISTPAAEVEESVASFRWTLAAIAAAVLAVTALVALVLSRWVTGPLRELERAASRAGGGDLGTRATTSGGPPEVRSLAHSFNEMIAKLEEQARAQDAFVADASHQLRTPLTALRLRLENGDSEGALPEVERLSRIVDALLALARAEGAPPEVVELAPAVAERLDAWAPLASSSGIRLEADVAGHALVGRDRLDQVLDNLLANALVATPDGSSVSVRGNADALHVRDQGPGLSAADRARAFDRFWTKGGGSGLGLGIVKRLVEVDGGTVELENADGGGLDVVLQLGRAAR